MADPVQPTAAAAAIAASAMKAQQARMQVIAQNVANADSTSQTPGGDPYRRRIPTFTSQLDRSIESRVVALGPVRPDTSDFKIKHEPGSPAADAQGNVKYPNVNPLIEMTDMRDAQRSYEANLNVITATRRMLLRTISILSG